MFDSPLGLCRWYASSLLLADGRVYIYGGDDIQGLGGLRRVGRERGGLGEVGPEGGVDGGGGGTGEADDDFYNLP